MGEKVEIINEHWSRSLLERDTLDYSKFYRRQIEDFLDVSRKDTEKYKKLYEEEQKKNNAAIEYIKSPKLKIIESDVGIRVYKFDKEELLKILGEK